MLTFVRLIRLAFVSDFDTSGPSYVPLSPVRRDCDSPESPTSDDMPLGEMDKPNSTGNYHWCAFCPATFDQIVTLKAHEQVKKMFILCSF